MFEFHSTILGGLPVMVRASSFPAEPDVGIFREYVEIDGVYLYRVNKTKHTTKFRPIPKGMWKRMEQFDDVSRLEAEALEG